MNNMFDGGPGDDADNKSGIKTSRPWLRTAVQLAVLLFVVYIGIRFGMFVSMIRGGEVDIYARPPSVEAFLPISSLMSLLYLIKGGVANTVHPAGLVIFTIIVLVSLMIRRGFCGWICPIGTISEFAQKLGRLLFGSNLNVPRWLDVPLLSIKYILLGFFLYHILPMPAAGLAAFINSPYNKIADVKMYIFFEHISVTAFWVIFILFVISIPVRHFWCRYLCPYGALLGVISLASPAAVRRNEDQCIRCGKCEKACPNSIKVRSKKRVNSVECMACYSCVDSCPVNGALDFEVSPIRASLRKEVYALITVLALFALTQVFALSGYWQTSVAPDEYIKLYSQINFIGH